MNLLQHLLSGPRVLRVAHMFCAKMFQKSSKVLWASALPHDTRFSVRPWFAAVLCRFVLGGVVLYGVVWFGVVWWPGRSGGVSSTCSEVDVRRCQLSASVRPSLAVFAQFS